MKNILNWLCELPFWEVLLIHMLVYMVIAIMLWLPFKGTLLSFFNRPKKGYWTIIGDVPVWVPGEEEDEDL